MKPFIRSYLVVTISRFNLDKFFFFFFRFTHTKQCLLRANYLFLNILLFGQIYSFFSFFLASLKYMLLLCSSFHNVINLFITTFMDIITVDLTFRFCVET